MAEECRVTQVRGAGFVGDERVLRHRVTGPLAQVDPRGGQGRPQKLLTVLLEQQRRDLLQQDGVVALKRLENVVV